MSDMPIPGAMNGSTDPEAGGRQELAELKDLLLGMERLRLDQLESQLYDPNRRAKDVSEVLPEAIRLRPARDVKLRRALEPLFEQSFRASVRRNPGVLAETLYPVIGAAIRKAVNAALAGLVETLNLTLENSFSAQSLKWRIEALRTGKSYGEIMLLHSVRYAVEQVFLIHRNTGLLLTHISAETAVIKDADLISGMLTAIQDFVSDSFGAAGAEGLEQMQVGEFTVWVQQGPQAILAGVIRGVPPAELKQVFQSALESIHRDLFDQLHRFDGDTAPFAAAEPALRACLLGRSVPNAKPRNSRTLRVLVNFLFLAAMLWVFLALRDRYRSNQLLAILRKEPGITVTNADWHFGRFTVYGLRDPMSHDPYTLVAKASLQPQTVEFHLEPYQSLDPAFTAQRRLAAERQSIETTVLRFESGSAVLLGSALDRLEEMVPHLKALFEAAAATGQSAKVEVLGHTDSTGADDTNALLAVARAAAVVAQMRSLGIAENQFLERGVGDRQPLRTGSGPRDQSFNRSVSFRIMLAGH